MSYMLYMYAAACIYIYHFGILKKQNLLGEEDLQASEFLKWSVNSPKYVSVPQTSLQIFGPANVQLNHALNDKKHPKPFLKWLDIFRVNY